MFIVLPGQMAKASSDVLKYPPITETTLKFHFAIILQLLIHYKLPFSNFEVYMWFKNWTTNAQVSLVDMSSIT